VKPAVLGINVENSFLAYPFLLDNQGRILFSAVGKAIPSDFYVLNKICDPLFKQTPPQDQKSKEEKIVQP